MDSVQSSASAVTDAQLAKALNINETQLGVLRQRVDINQPNFIENFNSLDERNRNALLDKRTSNREVGMIVSQNHKLFEPTKYSSSIETGVPPAPGEEQGYKAETRQEYKPAVSEAPAYEQFVIDASDSNVLLNLDDKEVGALLSLTQLKSLHDLMEKENFEALQNMLEEIKEGREQQKEEAGRELVSSEEERLAEKAEELWLEKESTVEEQIREAIEEAAGDERKLALLLAEIEGGVVADIVGDIEAGESAEEERERLERGEGKGGAEIEEKEKKGGEGGVALEEVSEEKEKEEKEKELAELVEKEIHEGELPEEELSEEERRAKEKEAAEELEEEEKELRHREREEMEELEKIERAREIEEKEGKGGKGASAMKTAPELERARAEERKARHGRLVQKVGGRVRYALAGAVEAVKSALAKERVKEAMRSAEEKALGAMGIEKELKSQDVSKFAKEVVEGESKKLAEVLDKVLASLGEMRGGGAGGALGLGGGAAPAAVRGEASLKALVAFEQFAKVELNKVRPEVLDWMIDTLSEAYEKEQNLFVKNKLLGCLGSVLKWCQEETKEREYVKGIFEKALVHPYSGVREAALEALGMVRGEWSVQRLGEALADADFGVRHAAIRSFARMFRLVDELEKEGVLENGAAEGERRRIVKAIAARINVIGEWVGKELNSKALIGQLSKENLEVRMEILDLLKEVERGDRAVVLLSADELAELERSVGKIGERQVLMRVPGMEMTDAYERIVRETKRLQLYAKVAALNAMIEVKGKRDEKSFAFALYMLESEDERVLVAALNDIGKMSAQFRDDVRVVAALLNLRKRKPSKEIRELLEYVASLYNVVLRAG